MPKAAMYKNHFAKAGEHNIRTSREIFTMETEAISHRVHNLAYRHLWLRIELGNCRHYSASDVRRNNIHIYNIPSSINRVTRAVVS